MAQGGTGPDACCILSPPPVPSLRLRSMVAGQGRADASVHGIAGAVAGQLSTLVLYPFDQARFLMQIEGCSSGAPSGRNTSGGGRKGPLERNRLFPLVDLR